MRWINRRQLLTGVVAWIGHRHSWSAFALEARGREPMLQENRGAPATLLSQEPAGAIEHKVQELLAQMSIDEKVPQLCSLKLGPKANEFTTVGAYTPETLQKYFGATGVGVISLPIAHLDAKAGTEVTNLIQKMAEEHTRLGIPPMWMARAFMVCAPTVVASFPPARHWEQPGIQSLSCRSL